MPTVGPGAASAPALSVSGRITDASGSVASGSRAASGAPPLHGSTYDTEGRDLEFVASAAIRPPRSTAHWRPSAHARQLPSLAAHLEQESTTALSPTELSQSRRLYGNDSEKTSQVPSIFFPSMENYAVTTMPRIDRYMDEGLALPEAGGATVPLEHARPQSRKSTRAGTPSSQFVDDWEVDGRARRLAVIGKTKEVKEVKEVEEGEPTGAPVWTASTTAAGCDSKCDSADAFAEQRQPAGTGAAGAAGGAGAGATGKSSKTGRRSTRRGRGRGEEQRQQERYQE